MIPPFWENNNNKIAENVINFKAKLNTNWIDLCTTTTLKETVLISFEYYSKASKQFICSASSTKASTSQSQTCYLTFVTQEM